MSVSVDLLKQFSPFQTLIESQLIELAAHATVKTLNKGSFIFKRGKDLSDVDYLVSGQVDLVDASFNSESIAAGEEADRHCYPLCDRSPTPYSAMAKTTVQILSVDVETYEMAQFWADEQQFGNQDPIPEATLEEPVVGNKNWMVHLLDYPLFAQVAPMQLQQLFGRFEAHRFKAGERVIKEGSEGDYFYVIERGRAQVSTREAGVIAELTPGQYFGEEALVGDSFRNATVVMLENGTLMRLDKEDFRMLLQEPLLHYIDKTQLTEQPDASNGYRLLDVRLPVEYRKIHVKDSANVPLFSLRKRLPEFDHETVYIVTDDAGKRSEVAAHLLCQAGFTTYILEDSSRYYQRHS